MSEVDQKTDAADYAKIKELYSAALDVDTGNRENFLKAACFDPRTRAEVESLILAHTESEGFLEDLSAAKVIQNSFQKTLSDKLIGQVIDKYRVIREIGRGGMGIVFLAEHETFRHEVAIKIIKRGMDSEAIIERFLRERQILASLSHPFIAKLLDGGTISDGLPFFVMEFVDGVAIDEYCVGRKEKEIVELYRKVCSAISFAHQKLVVHRDLKPSNILIDNAGEPKLLDFGIAKLLDATEADETQPHQRVLTPRYASPEQCSGAMVGTASDVFSLGKILSELLGKSSEGADKVSQRLSGDIEIIVSKAVSEDVETRYSSVDRFSDDLRRYLEDLPISAR